MVHGVIGLTKAEARAHARSMRKVRLTLTTFVVATGVLGPHTLANVSSTASRLEQRHAEAGRLRTHFDAVDLELRGRDTSILTPAQRAMRFTLISWLRDYRNAGMFPENTTLPNRAPFFRDDRGVLCAMAYLIARSGRTDIVDRVARTKNNAYIPELAGDHDLARWLEDAGLTVTEAARIQPDYGPCGFMACPVIAVTPAERPVSHDYSVASLATGATSLTTMVLNVASPSRLRGWAGVFAGSVEIVAGATHFHQSAPTTQVARANLVAGGAALAVGLDALRKVAHPKPVTPPRTSGGPSIDLALLSTGNALSHGTQRGLQVRVTF
jgi:hypothetical protein